MTKRPSVMVDFDALKPPAPAPAAPEPETMPDPSKPGPRLMFPAAPEAETTSVPPAAEREPVAPISQPGAPEPPPTENTPQGPARAGGKAVSDVFRTSLYFHRSVHDALRDIAHAERATVSDLINEGLDMVLKARGLPSTADLKAKAMRKRKRAGA